MANELKRPELIIHENGFCPGCGHGIMAKLLCNVFKETGVDDIAIASSAVGCGCMIKGTMGIDWVQAQHGRASAVAAGMKRVHPENFVFSYQGDGDAAAIGIAETIYSAKRNEKITTIFINNGVFGMTGGQTAPTSLEGQITTTAQSGCDYDVFGKPMMLAELISTFDVGYVARGSISSFKELQKTKNYIKKAIECQMAGKGYSFVEIMAPCPTNWKLSPVESMERIEKVAMAYFPCGELKGLGD